MKNAVFSDVRIDVSEERSASIIRVRMDELGTTLTATSNRRTMRRKATRSSETSVLTRTTRSYIPDNDILQANRCPQTNRRHVLPPSSWLKSLPLIFLELDGVSCHSLSPL
jgi:hypothetical protein